jgi:FkbM family methyltransferase
VWAVLLGAPVAEHRGSKLTSRCFRSRTSEVASLEKALIYYARYFPIRRGKLRLVNTLWQVAAVGRGAQRTAELVYSGYRMPCDLHETLQRQFYFFGTYFVEQALLECWQTLAKTASVVFDVGANAGIYSLAAISSNRAATVYAFEPTPEIAARLRSTAAFNQLDQLNVQESAVTDTPGHVALIRCRGARGTNEGMNFIQRDSETGERVRAETLDDFCRARSIDRIDLMKIDVQGHEAAVLRGASELLNEGRIGVILMELNWWADDVLHSPAMESVQQLETAGFRFAKPAPELIWQSSGRWLHQLSDVLARRVAS